MQGFVGFGSLFEGFVVFVFSWECFVDFEILMGFVDPEMLREDFVDPNQPYSV